MRREKVYVEPVSEEFYEVMTYQEVRDFTGLSPGQIQRLRERDDFKKRVPSYANYDRYDTAAVRAWLVERIAKAETEAADFRERLRRLDEEVAIARKENTNV